MQEGRGVDFAHAAARIDQVDLEHVTEHRRALAGRLGQHVGVLAEAILRDCGRSGVRTAVVAEDRASEEIAALASHRPPEPLPWWLYATVDPDLDFADWRNSILCLASLRDG